MFRSTQLSRECVSSSCKRVRNERFLHGWQLGVLVIFHLLNCVCVDHINVSRSCHLTSCIGKKQGCYVGCTIWWPHDPLNRKECSIIKQDCASVASDKNYSLCSQIQDVLTVQFELLRHLILRNWGSMKLLDFDFNNKSKLRWYVYSLNLQTRM